MRTRLKTHEPRDRERHRQDVSVRCGCARTGSRRDAGQWPGVAVRSSGARGKISAVVPHAALIGAQHILRRVYRYSWDDAARLISNFRGGKRIYWYDSIPESVLRDGLAVSGAENIEGWDGYYAAVARSEGVETVLTLDDDFERIDDVACEVVLSDQQAQQLNTYIQSLRLATDIEQSIRVHSFIPRAFSRASQARETSAGSTTPPLRRPQPEAR